MVWPDGAVSKPFSGHNGVPGGSLPHRPSCFWGEVKRTPDFTSPYVAAVKMEHLPGHGNVKDGKLAGAEHQEHVPSAFGVSLGCFEIYL